MADDRVYDRLSLLEAQVRYLAERTGIPLPDFAAVATSSVSAAVQAEIAKGNKINAIKLYREETGCSLLAAKNVIDSFG